MLLDLWDLAKMSFLVWPAEDTKIGLANLVHKIKRLIILRRALVA